jgi:hypothetical protein
VNGPSNQVNGTWSRRGKLAFGRFEFVSLFFKDFLLPLNVNIEWRLRISLPYNALSTDLLGLIKKTYLKPGHDTLHGIEERPWTSN